MAVRPRRCKHPTWICVSAGHAGLSTNEYTDRPAFSTARRRGVACADVLVERQLDHERSPDVSVRTLRHAVRRATPADHVIDVERFLGEQLADDFQMPQVKAGQ